jgi:hypothetical protein
MDKRELPKEGNTLQAELAELVKSSLVQMGDMAHIRDQIREVSEQLSKVTPPPHCGEPDSGESGHTKNPTDSPA